MSNRCGETFLRWWTALENLIKRDVDLSFGPPRKRKKDDASSLPI